VCACDRRVCTHEGYATCGACSGCSLSHNWVCKIWNLSLRSTSCAAQGIAMSTTWAAFKGRHGWAEELVVVCAQLCVLLVCVCVSLWFGAACAPSFWGGYQCSLCRAAVCRHLLKNGCKQNSSFKHTDVSLKEAAAPVEHAGEHKHVQQQDRTFCQNSSVQRSSAVIRPGGTRKFRSGCVCT